MRHAADEGENKTYDAVPHKNAAHLVFNQRIRVEFIKSPFHPEFKSGQKPFAFSALLLDPSPCLGQTQPVWNVVLAGVQGKTTDALEGGHC